MINLHTARPSMLLRTCAAALTLVVAPTFDRAAAAVGTTVVTLPAHAPVLLAADGAGLAALDVRARGFSPGAQVFVEQCDGTRPDTPGYDVNVHCDLGTSPAAATAQPDGTVLFASTDRNRRFSVFVGESPQNLFNCVAPKAKAPQNSLPTFDDCQLRVASTNSSTTADQLYATIVLPAGVAVATAPSGAAAGSAPAGGSGVSAAPATGSTDAAASASRENGGISPMTGAAYTVPLLVAAGFAVAAVTIRRRRRRTG